MLKFKTFFLILTGILLFSVASEARVCFLAGGSGEADDTLCLTSPQFESTICPGYSTCEAPEIGASSCEDSGNYFYRPEECCTDSRYEPCDTSAGKVCTGVSCLGTSSSGGNYISCEIGKCLCDSSYTETCAKADGLIGVGTPCDGKYQSCKCDDNYYYKCEGGATCQGATCSEPSGEKCTSCVCPVADEQNWVSDSSSCCSGVAETCINRPSNVTVYKCRASSIPDCICGYNNSTNGNCINGCTDRNYTYAGNIPAHAICSDFTSGITAACGNGCYCEPGYWDYFETCKKQPTSICVELGYTDTLCPGNYIGCPYDASAKKCLGADISCQPGQTKDVSTCTSNAYFIPGTSYWELKPFNHLTQCGTCNLVTCNLGYATSPFFGCGPTNLNSHWTLDSTDTQGQCQRCVEVNDPPLPELETGDLCCESQVGGYRWDCQRLVYSNGLYQSIRPCPLIKPTTQEAGYGPWDCRKYQCKAPSTPEEVASECCTQEQLDAMDSGLPLNFKPCLRCDVDHELTRI